MEQENRTQIDLHKKVKESREWEGLAKLYNINRLLQYFGIIYFFVVIYFWNCGWIRFAKHGRGINLIEGKSWAVHFRLFLVLFNRLYSSV